MRVGISKVTAMRPKNSAKKNVIFVALWLNLCGFQQLPRDFAKCKCSKKIVCDPYSDIPTVRVFFFFFFFFFYIYIYIKGLVFFL